MFDVIGWIVIGFIGGRAVGGRRRRADGPRLPAERRRRRARRDRRRLARPPDGLRPGRGLHRRGRRRGLRLDRRPGRPRGAEPEGLTAVRRDTAPDRRGVPETVIIETDGLAKRYGRTDALVDLTMSVERGRGLRVPRPERRRQDDRGQAAARPRPADAAAAGTVLGAPLGDRAARRRIGYLPGALPLPAVAARPRGPRAPRPARSAATPTGRRPRSTAVLDEVGPARPRRRRRRRLLEGHAAAARPRRRAARLAGARRSSTSRRPRSTRSAGPTSARSSARARDAGTTVFLNSHLLTEVERVCDRVAIVDHGRVLASGRLDDLLGRVGGPDPRHRPRPTAAWPGWAGSAGSRRRDEGWLTIAGLDPAAIPDVVAAIVAAGGRVHAVDPGRATLEDRFLELIGGGDAARVDAAPASRRPPDGDPDDRRPDGRARPSAAGSCWVLAGADASSASCSRRWGVERLVVAGRGRAARRSSRSRSRVSQILILVAFMFSFVLAMTAAFLGAPAIAADLESGVAHADARPADPAVRPRRRPLARARASWSSPTPSPRGCSRSSRSASSPATSRREPLAGGRLPRRRRRSCC